MSFLQPKQIEFDIAAFYNAMDEQRQARGLSWPAVAREVWNQSPILNAWRKDHPISPSTLTSMAKRGDTTCQHALFFLRWLGRDPESFVPGLTYDHGSTALPDAGADERLRWNLRQLYEAIDGQRHVLGLTWAELARELRCTPSQLSGIERARFAISMKLAMRIVQWLHRPAKNFIYTAHW